MWPAEHAATTTSSRKASDVTAKAQGEARRDKALDRKEPVKREGPDFWYQTHKAGVGISEVGKARPCRGWWRGLPAAVRASPPPHPGRRGAQAGESNTEDLMWATRQRRAGKGTLGGRGAGESGSKEQVCSPHSHEPWEARARSAQPTWSRTEGPKGPATETAILPTSRP